MATKKEQKLVVINGTQMTELSLSTVNDGVKNLVMVNIVKF